MIIISIVKEVIDNWDPIGLLTHAPRDEYYSEIKEIEQLLKSTNDYIELATGIYDVFIKSFTADVFNKDKFECRLIARKLISSFYDATKGHD